MPSWLKIVRATMICIRRIDFQSGMKKHSCLSTFLKHYKSMLMSWVQIVLSELPKWQGLGILFCWVLQTDRRISAEILCINRALGCVGTQWFKTPEKLVLGRQQKSLASPHNLPSEALFTFCSKILLLNCCYNLIFNKSRIQKLQKENLSARISHFYWQDSLFLNEVYCKRGSTGQPG